MNTRPRFFFNQKIKNALCCEFKKTFFSLALVGLLPQGVSVAFAQQKTGTTGHPNVVLIMCDDMGFSDLGCYGSEIKTPNIDALAEEGIRFSQFKNTGRCCPSRAALLTGRYQHAVNMGWMTAVDEHRAGYRGQIPKKYPTIAEVFRENGYSTYMAGKWHVTLDGAYSSPDSRPNGSYPLERGFDRYYGALTGGGSYYKPRALMDGNEKVKEIPKDFYYTHAITNSATKFINEHNAAKPFFIYIAHYAPHLPLQAPADRVAKCRSRYEVGYDVLRERRFDKLKKLGAFPHVKGDAPIHQKEFNNKYPKWENLPKNKQEAWINNMATYAAMIEIVDDGIGEVVQTLKKKNLYKNTIFLFMSDNGATQENGEINQLIANLGNTPYRSYKQWCFMGGISSPLIICYPKQASKDAGTWRYENAHIIDILPTCVNLAGIKYPKTFAGTRVSEPDGKSLLPVLQGKKIPERPLFFEHQTSSAIILGDWKLVRKDKNSAWELIQLSSDLFEQRDVAEKYPKQKKELEEKWTKWATQYNVFPLENRSWGERINFYKKKNPDQLGKE